MRQPETRRKSQVFMDSILTALKLQESENENESSQVISELDESTTDDKWWEEEAALRETPLINALQIQLETLLRQSTVFSFSFNETLTREIAEEVSRTSRQETGGMRACRVFVRLISESNFSSKVSHTETSLDKVSVNVGCLDLSAGETVSTFELYVYLCPSQSPLNWIRSVISAISSKTAPKQQRCRAVRLQLDFVLMKRKLFRSQDSSVKVFRQLSFKS
uniref:Uncharacterized LOC100186509 n=1 Tax=Ciona intestinalis TaxID=7719 RepID=F6R579_CIOIN|nr:uncharacterized protein LOC100186509 [Ciona intestinalis]|eukprot:XP_002131675.1 uncharacterized protein LOC100186509 [Ciona intestinalis]